MAAETGRGILATSHRDSFTGVAARSVPVARPHSHPLPTPPNSISPALPPHGLKAQLQKAAKLEPIDSDLDLQDLSDEDHSSTAAHGNGVAALAAAAAAATTASTSASAAGGIGSPPFESADAITPTMLAKYHLPEILLNHGPLAIRYIIGHLTASVPGFSFIPPAKARRLVVASLEGRGNGGEGGLGGLDGDVEFQKVSWGIWGARRLGHGRPRPAPPQGSSSLGIPIANAGGSGGGGSAMGLGADRLRQHNKGSGALYRETDLANMHVMEDEADKMSMDDDDHDGLTSVSFVYTPDDDMAMDDDPDNLTDDEDWGAMGAAALRAASYSKSATAGRFGSPIFSSARTCGSFGKFSSTTSTTHPFSLAARAANRTQKSDLAATGFSPLQRASDEQEREAIEGLLRLGSV